MLISGPSSNKIFCFGLDNAGKTCLTQFIKTGSFQQEYKPTIVFGIEDLVIKGLDFRLWDAPGQLPYRKLWGKGIDHANISIFVLDTADKPRFKEAKQVLNQVLGDPLTKNIPLVFCFHKMDLPEAKTNYDEAVEFFSLHSIMQRDVFVHFTSIMDDTCKGKIKRRLVELVHKGQEKK